MRKQQYTIQQIKQNRGFFTYHKYLLMPEELGTLYQQFSREYANMQGEYVNDNVVSIDQGYVLELRGFLNELKEAIDEGDRK
jgi:hypothetical protein